MKVMKVIRAKCKCGHDIRKHRPSFNKYCVVERGSRTYCRVMNCNCKLYKEKTPERLVKRFDEEEKT